MNKKELNEQWKASVISSPQFSCGRLDMQSWDASDCQQEKYVYVAGEEEGYQIKGRYCDEIAYAAAHYQEAMREIERLKKMCAISSIAESNHKILFAEYDAEIERLNSPWVSVDYRLPEKFGAYYVRGNSALPSPTMHYQPDSKSWFGGHIIEFKPLYWMKIPASPEGKV